jgi:hypothetical protein
MAKFINKNFTHLIHSYRDWKKTGATLEGSSRCFSKDQLIQTKLGVKKISDILEGEEILTFNEKSKIKEYKNVKKVYKFKNNKKSIRVKLKNGFIIECTEDHKFYFNGKWVTLKNIIKYHEGNKL